jgi:hypothetical protein
MNTEQKQILYDALMEGVPADLILATEAVVTDDLDTIEPFIDAMLDAARDGSDPLDWTKQDVGFEFYPDGDEDVLVKIDAGVRKFSVTMTRSRMKSLGEKLIEESGE